MINKKRNRTKFLSHKACHNFNRLAHKGRTIIFSIHQPRYTIYRTFDSITLLSGGETIYFGPSSDALEYFETIGKQ